MRNDCFNCQYSYTVEEGPPAECGPCEPQYKSESPSGWTAKGSIMETLTILTEQNARTGLMICSTTGRPRVDRRLIRSAKGDWYYRSVSGTTIPIPCSQFYKWMIVEDAPEPDLVALDQQNPPTLPAGHVDQPSRTLQAVAGMIDEAVATSDAVVGCAETQLQKARAKRLNERLKDIQALIGNKANSVLTKPAASEVISLVDQVISRLEEATGKSSSVLVSMKSLEEALEAQYELRGMIDIEGAEPVKSCLLTACRTMLADIVADIESQEPSPRIYHNWKNKLDAAIAKAEVTDNG